MPQPRRQTQLAFVISISLLAFIGLIVAFRASRDVAEPSPQAVVQSAWKQAQQAGAYHFTTRITQKTHPAPRVANVGSGSRVETMYLDGDADLEMQTLLLRMWQDEGRVTDASSGVEVRVEGDKVYGRAIGGEWQPVNNDFSNIAPGNDMASFLVAARNVEENNEGGRTQSSAFNVNLVSYNFTLHTPTLADYLRQQLEEQLSKAGELPPGLHLDTPEVIRNATGDGEVWIDESGFPRRLTIHVEYPPQANGENIEVEIQTDFSNFPQNQKAAALHFPMATISQLINILSQPQIAFALSFVWLAILFLTHRRAKMVYVGVVVVVIFSMLVAPLLQSAQAFAFTQKWAARQAESTQQQKELAAAEQAKASLTTSDWDPHQGQLPAASQQASAYSEQVSVTGQALPLAMVQSSDSDSDEDSDGLTQIQEERLGTDPNEQDSDGDQITDDVEIAGFEYNGQKWYTGPSDPDSNSDGLMDGLECPERAREDENSLSPNGICRDLDGDGDPDIFDRDNDDDGVPDRMDISPFDKMDNHGAPFTTDDPLLLKVDDLQADQPVFVDFQLRPTNPDHLWYAFNVLDWPSGDEQGQVQRQTSNDSTFADIEENPSDNASNGDMRLVPMLEIVIPYKDGHYGNLPLKDGSPITRTLEMTTGQWLDTSQLEPYGISVREMNDDGDLAVYVPISLVSDEYGSDRVAFSARMLYWPIGLNADPQQTDWGNTQQVRVVWAVQMLTDSCQPQESGPCEWVLDQTQFVRAYPEDWYLTGLNVQEDHGLEVAVVYEDPSQEPSDADRQYEDWLWALAHGLDSAFINGRDCEPLDGEGNCQGDGQPDITTEEIHLRWDNRINGSTSDDERWGIPITATQVVTFSYPHEGFVAHIMMTETQRILDDTFTAYVNLGSDAPTLLFTQESRYRSANLGEGESAIISDNQLTIRLDPENSQLTTRAVLSWAPYRYKDGEWQSYPIDEYWDRMETRFKAIFTEYQDDPDYEDIRSGQVLIAQSYYLSLYRGQSNIVQIGADLTGFRDAWQDDVELNEFLEDVEAGGGMMTRLTGALAKVFIGWLTYRYHAIEVTAFLKGIDSEYRFLFRNEMKPVKSERMMAGLTAIVTFTMIGLYITAMILGSQTMINVLNGVSLGISVLLTCQLAYTLVKAFQGSAAALTKLSTVATNAISKATGIGFLIAVGVIWGLFIAQIVMSGVKFGSMAFNFALAQTIASTLAAAILLLIMAIPIVGQIIAAIIGLFDSIVLFVCGLKESEHPICQGITGWMAYGIGWFIYSGNIMINLDDDSRLNIKSFGQSFVDPAQGMTAGSNLVISATVENHIHLISWADTGYNWKAGVYWWQYNSDTLASSNFRYHLQTDKDDHHSGLRRGGIRGYEWNPDDCDPKSGGCSIEQTASTQVHVPRVGINQSIVLYLTESYAAPAQECWTIPIPIWPWVIPVCYIRTEKGSSHIDVGSSLFYDVFPATLDDFYTLSAKDDGYALSWSQDSSPAFPRLKDADGDGLRHKKDGGADPNDYAWDTDGDGLSDYYERLEGSNPNNADSDSDGMPDREETIRGTNLLMVDSDYDGLTDREEVEGWEFVYDFAPDGSQLITWVTSDPLSVDPDLDTLSDFQEFTYGFHPRVLSDPHILDFESLVRETTDTDYYVLPGDPLYYRATIKNNLFNRYAQGLLGTDFPVAFSEIPPEDFVLNPQESVSLEGQVDVSPTTTSGTYNLTQNADAFIVDWREISNYADMLLHLDEEAGATTFEDSSGSQPPREGECDDGAGQCPTAGETGRYASALQFDGVNDTVMVEEANHDDPQKLTVTAWINPDTLPDGKKMRFVSLLGERAVLRYDGTVYGGPAQLHFYMRIDGVFQHVRVNNALQVGEWQFIAGAYDGTALHLYLNGEEIGSLAIKGKVGGSDGLRLSHTTETFDGLMDEVALYPRALSSAEIQALYNRPVLQLNLNEDFGATTFADTSGLGNDGQCGLDGGQCPTSGVKGISGNAVKFLGQNANTRIRADAVNNEIDGGAYSVGGFFNISSFDIPQTLIAFSMGHGYPRCELAFNMHGVKELQYYDPGAYIVNSGYALQANRWYHAMLVVEADDTAHLYVNGEEVKTFTTSARPRKGDRFTLGQRWYYDEIYGKFNGYLDNVAVYNFALAPDQVRSVYETNKALYLRLDDAPGVTTFIDSSGQNNASCSGDLCPTAGVNGRLNLGAYLDGQDDYLEAEPALAEDSYALSLWFKTTCDDCGIFSADAGELGSSGHDRDFYLSSGNLCSYLKSGETVCTSGVDYADGIWHYAVHTFGSLVDGQSIYVDAVLQAQGTMTSTVFAAQTGVNIGFANAAVQHYFAGRLDEVIITNRTMDLAEILRNFLEPPRLMLYLDEASGATVFSDDSGGEHHGSCSGNRCPDAGVKGQKGTAAEFDGVNDYIQVPHSDILNPDQELTLAVWVNLTKAEVDQKIFGKSTIGNGYVLGVKGSMLYPEIWDSSGTRYTAEWGNINSGFWTHLALTWKTNGEMVGYINGEKVGSIAASANPIGANTNPLRIGIAPWNTNIFRANGRIDQVTLYRRALKAGEVRALFRQQAKWVEEHQDTPITVDAEDPTSVLVSDNVYHPNQDVLLLVSAQDATSWVGKVELGVSTNGGGSYQWKDAPTCLDATGNAAWCPLFEPTMGEGRYLLRTRATDGLGHVESPSHTYTFLVDDTPPSASTAIPNGQIIPADRHYGDNWTLLLSGSVHDPVLVSGDPGSGASGVVARIYGSETLTDTVPIAATLVGNDWQVEYTIHIADPTGWYTLEVQSTDNMGNRSTVETLVQIRLDGTPPAANLEDPAISITDTITSTLQLTGLVTETGEAMAGLNGMRVGFIPAAMASTTDTVAIWHLEEADGADRFVSATGEAVVCESPHCPTAEVSGQWGKALEFDGVDDYLPADFVTQNITGTQGFSFGAMISVGERAPGPGWDINHAILAFDDASSGDRNQLFYDSVNEQYYYRDGTQMVYASKHYPDDGWFHLMVTVDGEGNGTLYMDGEPQESFHTTIHPDPLGKFSIGQQWDGSSASDHFKGYIDEITIYNRVLTPEEVRIHYGDAVLSDSGAGVISATWTYTVPQGLDGLYQINLLPVDVLGNPAGQIDWARWTGLIDTRAPDLEIEAKEIVSYLSYKTQYTCLGRDFDLVVDVEDPDYDFQCPCQTVAPLSTVISQTYYHEVSPWYTSTFSDTNHLYQYTATCTIPGPDIADTTTRACDIYGHCTVKVATPSELEIYAVLDSAVYTPTLNQVIDSTLPLTIEGEAYAVDHLKSLELYLDNNPIPIGTITWGPPDPSVQHAEWSLVWNTPTEGKHTLKSIAHDYNNEVQTIVHPVEIYIDTLPPVVTIDTTVITTTHRISQGRVRLAGQATDFNKVSSVDIQIDGGEWQPAAIFGSQWQYAWTIGDEPAREYHSVTARATDFAGRTTQVTQNVLVDLEVPNPITLSLTSGGEVIPPGFTLRSIPTTLDLTWITTTQRTDLVYNVLWTVETTQTQQVSHLVPPSGPFASVYLAGEAQRITPSVISRLLDGNQQYDTYGPVYVDSPLTPDFIAMDLSGGEARPYAGWMDSGCSLIGVDRNVTLNAQGYSALDGDQKLYATWDSQALRLAWTGANWDYAGDLFIYLDTTVGGAVQAFDPFTSTTTIKLPEDLGFGADVLVWVSDSFVAHLLFWESGEWVMETLTPEEYHFDAGLNNGQTDLYLPFDRIGIGDPWTSPLAMVAFATQEQALNLWGAMPIGNPVNAPNVVETYLYGGSSVTFGLTQMYFWPYLGPGVCPNQPAGVPLYSDTDLHFELSTNPAGSAYSFIGDDLFWLWEDLLSPTRLADLSESFAFMDADHPMVGDGDLITYTLYYENRGTYTATNVMVNVSALFGLQLVGGDPLAMTLDLGMVPPGGSGSVTFNGQVNLAATYDVCLSLNPGDPAICEPIRHWAGIQALPFDAAHGLAGNPIDWLFADHRIDSLPPEFFDIQNPEIFVNPGLNMFSGYAYDPAGVPDLWLDTLGASLTYCSDSMPYDGQWSCAWDAAAANGGTAPPDGASFDLRLQASDSYGMDSAWTDWRTFIVDAIPPEAAFSPATTLAFSGTVVSANTVSFTGVVTDNHGLSNVEVCLNGECGPAILQSQVQSLYTYNDASDITINGGTTCAGSEIVRTFTVTENFTIGSVSLGLNAEHTRRNDILALLGSPTGAWVQVLGPKIGSPYDAWNYDVLLSDAFGAGLHDSRGDDNPLPTYFDRHSRPDDPLRVFRGEQAAGIWTLKICDMNPLEDDGVYHRSQLQLKPANTAALTGAWSYSVSGLENLDSVAQILEVYATDLAGNRSAEPIRLDFTLDNVAPQVTAVQLVEQTANTGPRLGIRVLEGTASDGGNIAQMYAFVRTPQGNLRTMQVSWEEGPDWWFNLFPEESGSYVIWIYAVDEGGNTTGVGPFSVTVQGEYLGDHQMYLPVIFQFQWIGFRLYLPVISRE